MTSDPLVRPAGLDRSDEPQHADRRTSDGHGRLRRIAPGLLLGVGLGGFVDGIVLHQILQWHHMLTDYGSYGTYPDTDVDALKENTLWDGLFHAATWVAVVIGAVLLRRDTDRPDPVPGRAFAGLLLAGWGLFNVVEGVVDHHLLTIHHVRDDVADPLWWDLGFLAFGLALVVGGWALYRRGDRRPTGARLRSGPTA